MPEEIYLTEDQFEMNRKQCWEVYQSFNEIQWIKDNVVNKELAYPLEVQGINHDGQAKQAYLRRFNAYIKKINGPRAYAAKYWILPAVFFCMLFHELFINEEANLSAPFIIAFMLSIFTLKYQTVFTDIPFQYRYIGSFFLKPEELKLCAASDRMNKANKQASHLMGTFGPLLGFLDTDKTLYKALRSLNINYYEHQAILRGLMGIKNKVFDCVSMAALLTLKLIEQEMPITIERVIKNGNNFDGHSYIIINRDAESVLTNIDTWNDNCLIMDPWYEVFVSAKEIKQNKEFLLKYPLLNPYDKTAVMRIMGNRAPEAYKDYLASLNNLLRQHESLNSKLDI
ncbi:hypothetical protein [Rickettsiella endosymbiont of Miltochrista miniata]|uniref:hypothetical protein n=1 Tax=Rickettsiella endosymbiont of Miltochrista miniata TaxID=3066239 RepID=UPI00313AEFDB